MKVTLNSKAIHRLQQGHPWIFRSDIRAGKDLPAGVGDLESAQGKFLGKALYSPHSEIAIRFLTSQKIEVNQNFWKEKLLQAKQLREELQIASNAYRIVFGESDGIPSFILDKYDSAYSFQILSAGLEAERESLLSALEEVFSPSMLVERNDVSVRRLEQLPQSSLIIKGDASSLQMIEEGNLQFEVNLLEGQKTGAFLDQRNNRLKAAEYAKGKKKILDVCAYQGWFSCHMAQHAEEVTAIDQSEVACKSILRNSSLNHLDNIKVLEENAFDYLKELDRRKERFDLINLDPPAFVKSRKQIKDAMRGYKEINLRAMKMLEPHGILITSSCSHHLSEEIFLEVIHAAAVDSKRKVQILERGYQGSDHPVLVGFPESNYLKCFFLRIV